MRRRKKESGKKIEVSLETCINLITAILNLITAIILLMG